MPSRFPIKKNVLRYLPLILIIAHGALDIHMALGSLRCLNGEAVAMERSLALCARLLPLLLT